MATFWFWTIVAMLAGSAKLDRFDLSAGIIYLLVAALRRNAAQCFGRLARCGMATRSG